MGECPINHCGKPTEYFLIFIVKDHDGNRKGKALWGCVCYEHGTTMQDQYFERGREVELIPEKEAREKAYIERAKEITEWGKVRR